jgi:MFS family permease
MASASQKTEAMSSAPTVDRSPWTPLRRSVFRAIWLSSLVSSIGSTMNDTAAVWTMGTLSHSSLLLSVMATVSAVPIFFLSLPAGALADVLDRRRILLVAQGWMFGVATLLSVIAWCGGLMPWVLLAVAAALGLGVAFNSPAWTSIMPDLVAREEMPAAVTLGSLALNISRAVDPAIAGALIAGFGPAVCFTLNAVSFLAVLWAIWRWRPERKPAPWRGERFLGALGAAWRYAAHAPAMQIVLLRSFAFVFFGVAVTALLPIQAMHRLHLPASEFGLLMGAFGCGAIFMAVSGLPRLRASLSPDALMHVATVVLGAVLLAMIVSNQLLLLLPVTFFGGAAWIAGISNLSVASQVAMPPWARGRMNALYVTITQGAIALGALAWGQMTSTLGLSVALAVAGGALVATILLAVKYPLRLPYGLNLDPARPVTVHFFAAPPQPEDGPIVVTVEYFISKEAAAEFLAAMNPLRLNRLRDGAMRWSVAQDLGDPTRFVEEFTVDSWAEHLRQHERMAVSDTELHARVNSFHRGPERPRVQHFIARDVRVPAFAATPTPPVT